MSENRKSAKLTIHASASNSTILALAKVGEWTLLDHYQQLKGTADSQLWLWTTSPNG
jgi:hypothetical protein